MAENIEKIAAALGADIIGKVPETDGGAFGANRLAHASDALAQSESTNTDLLGSMRDYADELDEIVKDAMRQRQISGWRPNAADFTALEALSEATGEPLNALLDEALRLFLRQRQPQPPARITDGSLTGIIEPMNEPAQPRTSDPMTAAILAGLICPEQAGWSAKAAQDLLTLRFPAEDLSRFHALLARQYSERLTVGEQSELNSYLFANCFLVLLHERARLSLEKASATLPDEANW